MINGDQEYRLERRNTPQGVSGTRRTFLFLTIFHSYPNISIASPSSWSLFINTFRCSRLHVSELVLIYIALHMNDFGCLQENWLQSSSQFYSNVKWVAYFCRTELQCFCVWSLCTFKQCLVFRPPLVLCSMYIRTWWIQLYRSYKYKGKFARTGISTSNDHNSYLITAGAKILIFYESVILGHFRGVRRTAQWCSVVKTCPRDLLTLPMSAAKCRKMLWISPEMMT